LAYNLGSILTLAGHVNLCYLTSLSESSTQAYLCKTGLTVLDFTAPLETLLYLACGQCASGYFLLFLVKDGLMHPWCDGERGKFTKEGVRKYYCKENTVSIHQENTNLTKKKNPIKYQTPQTKKLIPPKNPTTEVYFSFLTCIRDAESEAEFIYIHCCTSSKIPSQYCKSIKRHITVTWKKEQAYTICFCPHQLQEITGTFMLLYRIINLKVTITF